MTSWSTAGMGLPDLRLRSYLGTEVGEIGPMSGASAVPTPFSKRLRELVGFPWNRFGSVRRSIQPQREVVVTSSGVALRRSVGIRTVATADASFGSTGARRRGSSSVPLVVEEVVEETVVPLDRSWVQAPSSRSWSCACALPLLYEFFQPEPCSEARALRLGTDVLVAVDGAVGLAERVAAVISARLLSFIAIRRSLANVLGCGERKGDCRSVPSGFT